MTVKRSPVSKWLTGRNVSTHHPEQGLAGQKGEQIDNVTTDAPAESAVKADWVTYRLSQGYTEEQLEGLTKAELVELADEPSADE